MNLTRWISGLSVLFGAFAVVLIAPSDLAAAVGPEAGGRSAATNAPAAATSGATSKSTSTNWIAIKAGHLFVESGQMIPNQIILIAGELIHSRGHPSEISIPAGATILDLSSSWVLPGLIDCHVHLASDRGGVAGVMASLSDGVAAHAYEAAVNARKTLDAGFTTVRNLGDRDGITLALRDAIAAGKVPGPRIIDAGASISATAGHMDPTLGFREELHDALDRHENTCNGVDDCRRAVRRQIARGVDVIKFATTGGVNSRIGLGLGPQMFEDEARAIVETAHLYGKKVAVHAHGTEGIVLALKAGADSIEHGTLLDEEAIGLFLKNGTYYVPTLSTINGYLERLKQDPNAYEPAVRAKIDWRIRVTGESLRRAYPRGVKIAFGTDAGVSKHGRNAEEFRLMVQHGMPPVEALRAATLHAADLLGLSNRVGSVTAGKLADLIAVPQDPLREIAILERVSFVMKQGVVWRTDPAKR
jgi:imidazolonepropionase-like amidohydrolase